MHESDESFTMFNTTCKFKNIIYKGIGLKQLGQIEEEAPPESYRVITIAPKAYMIESRTVKNKYRYKGLCMNDYLIEDIKSIEKALIDKINMLPIVNKLDKFGSNDETTINFYEKKLCL